MNDSKMLNTQNSSDKMFIPQKEMHDTMKLNVKKIVSMLLCVFLLHSSLTIYTVIK